MGEAKQEEEEQQGAPYEKEEASDLGASDIGRGRGKVSLFVDFKYRDRWNRRIVRRTMLGRNDCGGFDCRGCRRGSAWHGRRLIGRSRVLHRGTFGARNLSIKPGEVRLDKVALSA